MKRKPLFGYCALAADCVHVGHVRYMKKCKAKCQNLIVGLMTDEAIEQYKNRKPLQEYDKRREVLEAFKFVYRVIPQHSFEYSHNIVMLKRHYNGDFIIFDNEKYKRKGATKFFPYLEGISSTMFKKEYIL